VLDREPTTIPFSTDALQANLRRLQNELETVQANRDRDAIYQYLASVFGLVEWWAKEGKAIKRAYRALHLRGYSSVREPEPFAAIILCTSDPEKADYRTRSKWSRVLRYVAEYKDLDEPLRDFIQREGGHQQMRGTGCPVSWKKSQVSRRSVYAPVRWLLPLTPPIVRHLAHAGAS
jgi:hypothetical protein